MSENTNNKQQPSMTCKEALALFNTIRQAYLSTLLGRARTVEDYKEQERQNNQAWQAYFVLVAAVYGPPKPGQYPIPCEVCQRRYADKWAHERDAQGEKKPDMMFCCTPCLKQLQAEGKLTEIEGAAVAAVEGGQP